MKLQLKEPDRLNKKWIRKEIYLDGILKSNLDLAIEALHKDWDQVWFVDGAEGSGKSVLAVTCAYYVSPPERRDTLIDRIVVKIEEAPQVIKDARPYDSIVIDEGYGAMSSAGHMAKLNRMLQRLFTEIRAKNLFIFIVSPTFMDINRYFAIWRSKCLLHVYVDKSERGYASFFNADKKKKLYILGRKAYYNYGIVKPNFRFRFTNSSKDVIDWQEYKKRKHDKNLSLEEDEDKLPPHIMKKCWIQIRTNMPKLTKPLTQKQFAELAEYSTRMIQFYDAEIMKAKERKNNN